MGILIASTWVSESENDTDTAVRHLPLRCFGTENLGLTLFEADAWRP